MNPLMLLGLALLGVGALITTQDKKPAESAQPKLDNDSEPPKAKTKKKGKKQVKPPEPPASAVADLDSVAKTVPADNNTPD